MPVHVLSRFLLFATFFVATFLSFTRAETFHWARNGTGDDASTVHSVAVAPDGSAWATGEFNGTVRFGLRTLTSKGGTDVFVVNCGPNGTVRKALSFGTQHNDAGHGIAVGAGGEVFVTGKFRGSLFLNGKTILTGGGTGGFLVKLDSSGQSSWLQKFGGPGEAEGASTAVDADGNVFVTGSYTGSAVFGTLVLWDQGEGDAFLAKYSPDGKLGWTVGLGSAAKDAGVAVDVDAQGAAYLAGYNGKRIEPNGKPLPRGKSDDVFLVKFSPTGQIQWDGALYGTGTDRPEDLKVGEDGLYVVGSFDKVLNVGGDVTHLPRDDEDPDTPLRSDAFIARYDLAGNLLWFKSQGGSGEDRGTAVAIDEQGRALLAEQRSGADAKELIVTRFEKSGGANTLASTSSVQGLAGTGLASDGAGAVYLAGSAEGNATFGPATLEAGQGADAFLAKLAPRILRVGGGLARSDQDGSSWLKAYPTLQQALGAARAGDEIWVKKGTYFPTSDGNRSASFELKPLVRIYGGFSGFESIRKQRAPSRHVTVLSGNIGGLFNDRDNALHVVTGRNALGATLDGLVIANGYADGESGNPSKGGGVFLEDSAYVVFQGVTFLQNKSMSRSGAGGAVYASNSSVYFLACVFTENSARNDGGALQLTDANGTFLGCSFTGNAATDDGGAAYVAATTGRAKADFISCSFTNNSAGDHGGVLRARPGGILNVDKSIFFSNTAKNGAGLSCPDGGEAVVSNSIFTGNTATGNGGAIQVSGAGKATLSHVTITSNAGGNGQGGAVSGSDKAGSLLVSNSIVWGNLGAQITGKATVSHSIVQGAEETSGVLNRDPLFLDAANGVYYPRPGSPAIDAADSNHSIGATAFSDWPRTIGSRPDMGAFEHSGLVGGWRFNEVFSSGVTPDFSGADNNATFEKEKPGATPPYVNLTGFQTREVLAPGFAGDAATFDKSRQASLSRPLDFNATEAWTVSFWAKNPMNKVLGEKDTTTSYFAFNAHSAYFRNKKGNTKYWSVGQSQRAKWRHYAWSAKGNNSVHFHLDGVRQAGMWMDSGLVVNVLGAGYKGAQYRFEGELDEVRVFNRALASEEILQHYLDGFRDRDADGLTDLEEEAFDTNKNQADSDSDGVSDLLEVLASTDPKKAASFVDLSRDLVAYWPMDETNGTRVSDLSPNAAHGTLSGIDANQTASPWTSGLAYGALRLDGKNDCVLFPGVTVLDDLRPLSFAAWVKPEGEGVGYVVAKRSEHPGFWRLATGPSAMEFAKAFTGDTSITISKTGLTPGLWAHLAFTWDGSTKAGGYRLYKNGAEVAYKTRVNGSGLYRQDKDNVFSLGSRGGANTFFTGLLDEVRVWNRVLGPAEITALNRAITNDQDKDSLPDAREFALALNWLDPDSDDDEAKDGFEISRGTNPKKADTDEDGIPDGQEFAEGTDGLNKYSHRLNFSGTIAYDGPETGPINVKAVQRTARYAVIDLSAGPNAGHYPVTYSDSHPDLSDPTFKSHKILLKRMNKGTFTMGDADNGPAHSVRLNHDFYVGLFEVTGAQYAKVMGTDPSRKGGDTRPVENVSWNEIRGGHHPGGNPAPDTFLGRLRARTGQLFDLPTEAQWENAARAGSSKKYAGSNVLRDDSVVHAGNSGGTNAEVGSKKANPWGWHDFHGNVAEWTLDWKAAYPSTLQTDPAGPATGQSRVTRGGSWKTATGHGSADRAQATPQTKRDDLGFRLVLNPGDEFEKTHAVTLPAGTKNFFIRGPLRGQLYTLKAWINGNTWSYHPNDAIFASGHKVGLNFELQDQIRLQSGLVGQWSFEEANSSIARDSAGSRHGVLQNMTPANRVPGVVGAALAFDGVDDAVTIPGDFFTGAGARSVSLWIRSADGNVSKRDEIPFDLGQHTAGASFSIHADSNTGKWGFHGHTAAFDHDTSVSVDKQWRHHVLTFGWGRLKYYLDGQVVLSKTLNLTTDGSTGITLGKRGQAGINDADADFFDGFIDELALYERELSTAEIRHLRAEHLKDADGDGLGDLSEALLETNATNPDTDGDGLSDGQEVHARLNPLSPDSDSDGFSDKAELDQNSNPLDAASLPNRAPSSLKLSRNSIKENLPAGTRLGALLVTDPDDPDSNASHAFALLAGSENFSLDANGSVFTARPFDHETNATASFSVRVTDAQGASLTRSFTVNVRDVRAPIVRTLAPTDVRSRSATFAATLLTDGDAPVTHAGFLLSPRIDFRPGDQDATDLPAPLPTTRNADFNATATQLKPDTLLYLRAYARNAEGISYGALKRIRAPAAKQRLQPFPDSEKLGGGWRASPWFGSYHNSGSDWILHADYGWLYLDPQAGSDSLWFWKEGLGWLWTNKNLHPHLYQHAHARWLYSAGKRKGLLRLYDSAAGQWLAPR